MIPFIVGVFPGVGDSAVYIKGTQKHYYVTIEYYLYTIVWIDERGHSVWLPLEIVVITPSKTERVISVQPGNEATRIHLKILPIG